MTTAGMKDLLVYTADADALAFMRAVLGRPKALGIRPIEFDIERHPQRDAGMVQSGAELARMKKGRYHRALMMWDFAGCGREHRMPAQALEAEVQGRLDNYSWSGRSAVTVLVPELEVWLWHCAPTLAAYLEVSVDEIDGRLQVFAGKQGQDLDTLKREQPKELFEHLMREKLRRTISPRDFEEIGRKASIKRLRDCPSFDRIAGILQGWFPS